MSEALQGYPSVLSETILNNVAPLNHVSVSYAVPFRSLYTVQGMKSSNEEESFIL